MEVPARLAFALAAFEAQEPLVRIWRDYPHVTEEQDILTDAHACEDMSDRFLRFLKASGFKVDLPGARDVWIVEGLETDELVDYHRWVKVWVGEEQRIVNVDWTARQFYNLRQPPLPEHQELPCPLVWAGFGHPVVKFGRVRTV